MYLGRIEIGNNFGGTMSNEENMHYPTGNLEEKTQTETTNPTVESTPVSSEIEELAALEDEIDLNQVFPEEKTDLNELFPEMEMKCLLKKVQKNKKDLNTMRDRFSEGI
jgi:hypothetical protein